MINSNNSHSISAMLLAKPLSSSCSMSTLSGSSSLFIACPPSILALSSPRHEQITKQMPLDCGPA
jgi:hypothetical protein